MDRKTVLNRLREHRPELEGLGISHASVFGSTARGDTTESSDVDVAVVLDPARTPRGFAYISHLDRIERKLGQIIGSPVDVVAEPARNKTVQQEIERERARAF